jgi:uncharacterized membrane protein YeaQ/YmgE (transglycosylase-associated protein family)
MLIAAWIILGLVAGTIARSLFVASNEPLMTDMVLGSVGGLAAGWIANGFAVTLIGFNLHSVLAAFVGAGLLIVIFRLVRRRRYRGPGAWGART